MFEFTCHFSPIIQSELTLFCCQIYFDESRDLILCNISDKVIIQNVFNTGVNMIFSEFGLTMTVLYCKQCLLLYKQKVV